MAGGQGGHRYAVRVIWTGNRGSGTSHYRSYGRDLTIAADGKPDIPGSADTAFRGDADRWNPEELLVAALSSCHQLAYLHLCAVAGIRVVAYRDDAAGTMVTDAASGSGRFSSVTLRPHVTIRAGDDAERARQLHHEAHTACFIANSVNFPVGHEATIHLE
nr:OsmC family protein [uncultured Rhodopila sp.]